MVKVNEKVISTLNNLIRICREGEIGFRTAAENEEGALTPFFLEYSRQRRQFFSELRDEVKRLGGRPADLGISISLVPDGWTRRETVIAECEKGEGAALRTYEEALSQELPSDLRQLIQ